jgi:hypothetical protein
MMPLDGDIEHTGNAWPFTSAIRGLADPTDGPITRFAQVDAEELHDQDDRALPPLVARNSFNEDSNSNSNSDDDTDDGGEDDSLLLVGKDKDILISEDFEELYISPESRRARFQSQVIPQDPEESSSTEDAPQESPDPEEPSPIEDGNRRSQRPRKATNRHAPIDYIGCSATRLEFKRHAAMHAIATFRQPIETRNVPLQSYMTHAFQAETITTPASDDPSAHRADDFDPVPSHWKHVLRLPNHLKIHWIASVKAELKTLLCMMTFSMDITVGPDDDIIPVTTKFRTKLKSTGAIKKLKARICLRGDMQQKGQWDTWCPIAGFRALRIFLAMAARQRCRVFQLDFVGAFLQSNAVDRTITMLPKEWEQLFPELADWFGIPLLCRKSLCGGQHCNKSWDNHLSNWLEGHGLIRLPSEGSIFMKTADEKFLCLLNAVDDQLCFSNCDDMRREFEAAVKKDFDVDFLGQAHWHLQARITQNADFSITLDQSRYAALMCNRFIPTLPIATITDADRERYRSVLPSGFIATKQDLADDMLEVKRLEDEFGFKYASVIGMLIFLMNAFVSLHFAIRKLAKFMTRPGRTHYAAAAHLLRHLRCNTRASGIKKCMA